MPPSNMPSLPGTGAYDFLNQQPSQNRRGLPLPKLPRLAWIILIASISLLLLLSVVALLFGSGGRTNTNSYIESMAYAQEISRVSEQVKQLSQDPNTKSLASTTSAVMVSSNAELRSQLEEAGVKVDAKLLASKEDKEVDSQLQQAAQANRLPEAYALYLKTYLPDYQSSLQAAFNQSETEEGRAILQKAFDSVDIILASNES